MSDSAVFHAVPYVNGWTLSRSGGDEDKGELGAWDQVTYGADPANVPG